MSQAGDAGDTAANRDSNHTARHNKFNRACRDVIAAKARSEVILGDKGDYSSAAVSDAKARYKWANDGHVPDIIHKNAAANGNHVLYESKCTSGLCKSKKNLGTGTNDGGGSPGNSAGDRVAFGCTEDELCAGGSGTMGVGIFGRAVGFAVMDPALCRGRGKSRPRTAGLRTPVRRQSVSGARVRGLRRFLILSTTGTVYSALLLNNSSISSVVTQGFGRRVARGRRGGVGARGRGPWAVLL